MIPAELGITIEKALKMNPDLKHAYEEEDDTKRLIDTSLRLEGLPRHSSTHAAGVVICREPVMEYVPLSANDGQINTQYTMTILEELGLLKMDFLGLRTLTVIQSAVQEIERIHGIRLNMEELPENDSMVYDMICQGKTEGVFQPESGGGHFPGQRSISISAAVQQGGDPPRCLVGVKRNGLDLLDRILVK